MRPGSLQIARPDSKTPPAMTVGGVKNWLPPVDQLSAPITASMRFFMVEASNGLMM
jgi:hypothetical protein